MRTFTNYHYDKDEWTAAAYDKMPEQSDPDYVEQDGFYTLASQTDPQELQDLLRKAAQAHPDFAEEYGLTEFAAEPVVPQDYYRYLRVMSATFNYFTFPSPIYLQRAKLLDGTVRPPMFYHSGNSILFRYQQARTFQQEYEMDYLSPDYFGSKNAQMLIHAVDPDEWLNLLTDAAIYYSEGEDSVMLRSALDEALNAVYLDHTVESETPDSIKQLAEQLTAGIDNPYDKAMAISDHLKYSGQYIYSLEYQFAEDDNLETFLFRNKTGVCRQYAGAMVELCRAAGLTARYVEGYAMVDKDTRPFVGADNVYVITTEHGHAFVDVYIPGAGWVQFNPTASADIVSTRRGVRLTKALQFSGLILFGAALLFIVLTVWIIPMIGEFLFRRKFRKNMDAAAVQAAFARLRKQWKADPTLTARELCAEQGAFLGQDLSVLCDVFEQTLYADRCTPEAAGRFYAAYCAAYDGWRAAVKRDTRAKRAAQKAARAAAKAKAKAAAAI
jgi:transglutaminase-like putative cysteine protease